MKHILFLSCRAFRDPSGFLWLQEIEAGGKRGKASSSGTKSQLVAVPPHSHSGTCVPKPPTTAPEIKKKKKSYAMLKREKEMLLPAWDGERKVLMAAGSEIRVSKAWAGGKGSRKEERKTTQR